jgi:hypothetical protein
MKLLLLLEVRDMNSTKQANYRAAFSKKKTFFFIFFLFFVDSTYSCKTQIIIICWVWRDEERNKKKQTNKIFVKLNSLSNFTRKKI